MSEIKGAKRVVPFGKDLGFRNCRILLITLRWAIFIVQTEREEQQPSIAGRDFIHIKRN